MKKTGISFVAMLAVAVLASTVSAQVTAGPSGLPGDGIPDVYYYADEGATAPNGETRGAGTLQLDTDGADLSAVLVSDPNGVFFEGCLLCDGGGFFPPVVDPPGQFFTVGFINGASQWIRTFPLQGPGFLGITDLAGPGAMMPGPAPPGGLDESYFVPIFDDTAPESLWSFRYATDSSGQFFSDVTVVNIPEPTGFGLISLGLMALLRLRRR